MFGKKGLFGKKQTTFEEPKRKNFDTDETFLNLGLWEGEIGEALRSVGIAPDDPKNHPALQEPISAQLAAEKAKIARLLAATNPLVEVPRVACHLLPVAVWDGRFGNFLLKRLDLSPYRAWNTIYLQTNYEAAARFAQPLVSENGVDEITELEAMIEMIMELFMDKAGNEAVVVGELLDTIAGNFPATFPPEIRDYSANVRDARRRVRALAFLHSGKRVDKELVFASHQAFYRQPETQLVA